MNPADPDKQTTNPLNVMQPGETVVCNIKRHPIGIFGIYTMSGILLIALAVIVILLAPKIITSVNQSTVMGIGLAGYFVFALICLGFVFVANKVYWGNKWILTSDSITQVTQTSLFNKQSSQLSLSNLEDVTAEQNGILAHMLNYGTLKVETAGERSKFIFLYCPNPNYYAQQILDVREKFEQKIRTVGAKDNNLGGEN